MTTYWSGHHAGVSKGGLSRRALRAYGKGAGADVISTGNLADRIKAGVGPDVVHANGGHDVVYAGPLDKVARDCETVLRP